ncbi:hypothetical protein K1T71_011126 [Dendrolimus kikuchii]|uniref:Uncharacterized protein n=1 Tax=Dendrolimus kikuchii TaxID=765133 RepID=A0ACC1CMZ3_9NEOP|nr:hypothetical protein K1T71_011126 [Dendrolimus kikuchii]
MLFLKDYNYNWTYYIFWLSSIFISALHYGLAEETPIRCRMNVNCTYTTKKVYSYKTDYSFKLNGHDTLKVSLSDSKVVLAFKNMQIGLEDTNVPCFETVRRIPAVHVQNGKLPIGSYKEALRSMNILYFDELELYYGAINNDTILQPSHFEGLTDLLSLTIRCDYFDLYSGLELAFLRPLVSLQELKLVKIIVPPIPHFVKISKLTIKEGSFSEGFQSIGECGALETLVISGVHITNIPEGWLSRCAKLRALTLEDLRRLQKIPDRLLQGNQHLRYLKIKKCQIENVPDDLLSYTPELQRLDLYGNLVVSLPNGFFSNSSNIEHLFLGPAEIVHLDAGDEMNALPNLKTLVLDGISKYGLCRNDGRIGPDKYYKTLPFSAIMPKLEHLSLRDTRVTKICPEWKNLFPALKKLNLMDHSIKNLTYNDIQIIHSTDWEVDLCITSSRYDNIKIQFTESDFNSVKMSPMEVTNATILLNEDRICDCDWYWFIRSLKARPEYVSIPYGKCIWYDPPGSKNKMTTPIAETPESKLVCRFY